MKHTDEAETQQNTGKRRPLRIAEIGHKTIPSREGGVEIVVKELAVRFAASGDDVTAYNRGSFHHVDRDRKRPASYEGVRLIWVPTFHNRSLNAIFYSVIGSIRLLFGHFDVVHYHAEGPCIMLWLPKLFHIPVVATIHGLDWQRSKWGGFASHILKKGEATAAKKADAVIVLSRNMQDYFRQTYSRETIYIPNGISRPVSVPAQEITARWGLAKGNYILFLARLVPEKGIHYLIDAYRKIDTDRRLVIAGGDGSAPDYVNELKEKAAGDDRILFTGHVEGQVLEELYSNAGIFVLPSDVEGMAMSLLEAMSYGCCCIVSDIPENTEVTGDHAFTFRHGSAEDLERVLTDVLAHPEKESEMCRTAADYICTRYSWDTVADKTRGVYLSVLPADKRAAFTAVEDGIDGISGTGEAGAADDTNA